jgi:hypothetical protein
MPPLEPISPRMQALVQGYQFTVFQNVQVGPGASHDSMTAINLDGYRYVHFWLLAQHAASMAMDQIILEVVFEYSGMGATGLVNMEFPAGTANQPVSMAAESGQPAGGWGGFVLRLPVVGPAARVIVVNHGAQTYTFSVYGYATA